MGISLIFQFNEKVILQQQYLNCSDPNSFMDLPIDNRYCTMDADQKM